MLHSLIYLPPSTTAAKKRNHLEGILLWKCMLLTLVLCGFWLSAVQYLILWEYAIYSSQFFNLNSILTIVIVFSHHFAVRLERLRQVIEIWSLRGCILPIGSFLIARKLLGLFISWEVGLISLFTISSWVLSTYDPWQSLGRKFEPSYPSFFRVFCHRTIGLLNKSKYRRFLCYTFS